ncbi:MAG: tryptophan--tRNA ligase [Elusimicrobia bacterium]|nr:tryptophan--tRNA ligase [Elusimicrobiota bacterium]
MRKRAFSGIQPSGGIHLGNYLGALKNWVALQAGYECLYCIVDLHAITVKQEREVLRQNILATAMLCLACGIDPEKSILFVQSDVHEHSELAWILNCHATMGELRRMTQYKDKAKRLEGAAAEGGASVGLFSYPVLMASDILLYGAHAVPVGEDQKQHLELCRDLARRFNGMYGEIFVIPEPVIPENGARIMGLDDPVQKMSKSASSEYNYVNLMDEPSLILKKFKAAATDSGKEIRYNEKEKPGVSNLMNILSVTTGESFRVMEKRYDGKGYAQFKTDVAEAVIEKLKPIQREYRVWESHPEEVVRMLQEGAEKAREISRETLRRVKEKVGLGGAP